MRSFPPGVERSRQVSCHWVLDMHFVILVVVYGQIVRLRHEVHELVEAVQRLAVFDGGVDMLERPVGKERKLHGEDVQLVKVGVFIEHLPGT